MWHDNGGRSGVSLVISRFFCVRVSADFIFPCFSLFLHRFVFSFLFSVCHWFPCFFSFLDFSFLFFGFPCAHFLMFSTDCASDIFPLFFWAFLSVFLTYFKVIFNLFNVFFDVFHIFSLFSATVLLIFAFVVFFFQYLSTPYFWLFYVFFSRISAASVLLFFSFVLILFFFVFVFSLLLFFGTSCPAFMALRFPCLLLFWARRARFFL